MNIHNINQIKSISKTYQTEGYLGACGIDPDEKIAGRIGGAISPTNYTGTSGMDGSKWLIPNDKTTDVYFYTKAGKFGKVTEAGVITEITTITGTGNGMAYYNNYYYISGDSDIHRYGPIDGTPTMELSWWTSLIEEEDFFIDADGGEFEVNETNPKTAQIINTYGPFNNITFRLKNTGVDTSYNLKLTVQEVEETEGELESFTAVKYNFNKPEGEVYGQAIYTSAPGNDYENITFEFDEVLVIPGKFALILETVEPIESDQSFKIQTSEVGNEYSEGEFVYYIDGDDWNKVPPLNFSTDLGPISKDAGPGSVSFLAHTIDLLDEGTINSINVRFTVSSTTQTAITILVDGVQKFLQVDGSPFINTTLSGTFNHGDVVEIFLNQASSESRTITRSTNRPYILYSDNSREIDAYTRIASTSASFPELGNEEYPTIGIYEIPNHSFYKHGDNSLYFTDIQNTGSINRIRTADTLEVESTKGFSIGDLIRGKDSKAIANIIKIDVNNRAFVLLGVLGEFQENEDIFKSTDIETSTKVVSELKRGFSNLDSNSMVLELPTDIKPISISSFGTDIAVIGLSQSKKSSLFLWDTFAPSFYREIKLPFTISSALFNHNGTLYLWGGDANGYTLYAYQGGDTVHTVQHMDNGHMPLQGAINSIGDRLMWGSSQTYPKTKGCVWALGSRSNIGGLHNIATTTNQVASIYMKDALVIGAEKFYKKGGKYTSIFRSELLSFGRPFDVSEVVIPLSAEITSTDKLTITVYYDNGTASEEFVINKDTFENRIVKIHPTAKGVSNFFIEIEWDATAQIHVQFPISIRHQLYD